MDIRIKEFKDLTLSELYTLLKLREEVFIMEQKILYQDLDDMDQLAFHVMIFEDKEMVAYARGFRSQIKYEEASIGRVLTRLSYRNKGYGIPLMKSAMRHLFVLGENSIKISAQAYAQAYYEKLGFLRTNREPYLEDTIPHVEMLYHEEA